MPLVFKQCRISSLNSALECILYMGCSPHYVTYGLEHWTQIDPTFHHSSKLRSYNATKTLPSLTGLEVALLLYRSEVFPKGTFHSCALWARAPTRWKSCQRVAVVAASAFWKFRATFRPGKLDLDVFLLFWGCDERYLTMQTGVLHIISMHIS